MYILAIRCYAQNCMHSVFLQALKKQRYHHAMVIYHCIRWYRMHVIRIHLFYLMDNQANRMYHGTWHYWYRFPLCICVNRVPMSIWKNKNEKKRKGTEISFTLLYNTVNKWLIIIQNPVNKQTAFTQCWQTSDGGYNVINSIFLLEFVFSLKIPYGKVPEICRKDQLHCQKIISLAQSMIDNSPTIIV